MAPVRYVLAGAAAACSFALGTTAMAETTAQEKANIATVRAFYDAAINQKDFEKARSYLGNRYIQHNPLATDGPEGLKGYIEVIKQRFPQQHNDFKRFLADGDYVIVHVHSVQTPGTRGRAIVDIFKLEQGKVVEHWDVIQDVPDPATAKNANSMF
jgi:predicted SnoaL-like aldol condensation-catalyzing enzyme